VTKATKVSGNIIRKHVTGVLRRIGRPPQESDVMRRILNLIYAFSLVLSAACLLAITGLVAIQVGARVLDKLLRLAGLTPMGWQVLSLPEIAGFLLAGASFLALGPTLKAGAHIRVTMLLRIVSPGLRTIIERAVLAVALAGSLYLAYAMANLVWGSWRFNDLSIGLLPIPLIWPQLPLVIGTFVLFVALLDEAVIHLRSGAFSFGGSEDALPE